MVSRLCWSNGLLCFESLRLRLRHCEFGFSCHEHIVRVRTWTLVSNLPEHELQDVGRTFLYLRLQASRSDFVLSTLADLTATSAAR